MNLTRLQTIRDRPSDEPSCDHGLLMSARALWQVVVLGCLIPELTVGRKFVDASGRKQQQQNKPQLKQSYLPGLASSLSSQAMYTPEAAGNSTKG
ncbi:unnamed protein product [Protopolystoma xenopodis]|uniref:Uncharacterized protein n=1 Tax=Protopolystoma xenopodis TaxID=117903 RepID=A0A3S5C7Y2_9PLAT|nr:unnamed protein product [Protopolystoma xenopodis]